MGWVRPALLALLFAVVVSAPAEAAFPGDNGRIAFTAGDSRNGVSHITVMNAAVEAPEESLSPEQALDSQPSWSPNGQRIAFIRQVGNEIRIHVMDADGDNVVDLQRQGFDPAWSPDGNKIVYREPSSRADLIVVNADGSNPVNLTSTHTSGGSGPVWSPDGQEIAFASGGIVVMNADGSPRPDGSTRTRLTTGSDGSPDWSPDGSKIVFHGLRNPASANGLFVVNADGSPQPGGDPVGRVATGDFVTPAYSPDGTKIVASGPSRFPANQDAEEGRELYLMDADGDDLELLTVTPQDPNKALDHGSPDWQPEPAPAVAVTGSPPALTTDRTPTFEFNVLHPSPPPGRIECRVDGSGSDAFTPCASPLTVGPLQDGPHAFEVRYKLDGAEAGPVTRRAWTIDTRAPRVRITNAPSAGSNPPDATLRWTADESGVTFVCSLDGTDAFDCSSPHRLVGLSPGTHRFSVVGIDPAGNTSAAAVAEWVVANVNQAPPAAACAAPQRAKVEFGVLIAVARQTPACFRPATIGGEAAFVSTGGLVTVNGIEMVPGAGGRIELIERIGGGTLRLTGPVTLRLGSQSIPVNGPIELEGLAQGGVEVLNRTLEAASALTIGRLPMRPQLKIRLLRERGGSAEVKASLELPDFFRGVPGNNTIENLAVEAGYVTSNDSGGGWTLKGKVGEAWLFGRVLLKNLEVGYDDSAGIWSGQLGISLSRGRAVRNLPVTGPDATLTAGVEFGPEGLIGPLRKLNLQASSINKHIGEGIFLQRLGAGLARDGEFAKFTGNGGLSLGPRIDLGALFEGEAIALDGEITLAIPTGDSGGPYSLEIKGIGKVIEFEVIEQVLKYSFPPRFDWTAKLDFSVGGYGLQARLREFWFDAQQNDFNIEALGRAALPGFLDSLLRLDQVDVVVSTTGMAACFLNNTRGIGFGKVWGEDVQLFAGVCEVGPFRREQPVSPAGANGATSFTVRRGTRLKVVAARGRGAPPKVDLAGPGGVRIATPAGADGLKTPGALLVQDPNTDTTSIALTRPRAGRWTLTARDGAPMAGVRVADGLPPVRVRARVRGRGARRLLTWRARRMPGHRLTFVERTAAGPSQVVFNGRRTRGRRRFRPLPIRGRHTIEVTVSRGGIPRKRLTVARFAVKPPKLARVRGLRRKGRTLSWKPQAAADSYVVAIARNGVVLLNRTTRRPRIRVPRGRIVATVVPMGVDGRTGPRIRKRFRR